MSIFDKLFGHEGQQPHPQQGQPQQPAQQAPPPQQQGYQPTNQPMNDEQAVARYKYMLRTAPPETIEQAHQDAFAQLTPEQRKLVLQQLSSAVPPSERAQSDDPQSLARMATRAEVRQPGTLERVFGSSGPGGGAAAAPGGGGGGIGLGTMIGGSLLSSLAGAFIGTAIADHFFRGPMGSGFFGGGGGLGGFGGGYGGGTTINETNIYEGGSGDRGDRDSGDDAASDLGPDDDTKYDAADSGNGGTDSDSDTDSDTDTDSDQDSGDDGSYDDGGDDGGFDDSN